MDLLRSLRRPSRETLGALLDLILPPGCPACGEPGPSLCRPCRTQLEVRPAKGCVRCGEPVLAAGGRCGNDHRELRNLTRLVAPFRYAGTGGALVRRFKLDADAAAGHCLAAAMARAWGDTKPDPRWRRAVLVPVPLHWRRRRARGFDQAEWLVRKLARKLNLRTGLGALVRSRATLPQGDPRVTSRQENVATAFFVRRARVVAGRPVLLVDDVFTSGATARACAGLLAAAGAAEVAMLTACRS